MTRTALISFAAGCCCTASMMAAGTQAPTTAASPAGPGGTVVIRGCVERADEVMPLAGAALGTTVDSQEFVLIHARPAGAAAEAPAVGTSGTAASRGGVADPNGFGQVYRIDAAKTLINPHVGHEVEVTGTRDEPGTRTDARADATGTGTGEAPRLRVQSVKVIADTCGSRR